jgi:hypothetical protein
MCHSTIVSRESFVPGLFRRAACADALNIPAHAMTGLDPKALEAIIKGISRKIKPTRHSSATRSIGI